MTASVRHAVRGHEQMFAVLFNPHAGNADQLGCDAATLDDAPQDGL